MRSAIISISAALLLSGCATQQPANQLQAQCIEDMEISNKWFADFFASAYECQKQGIPSYGCENITVLSAVNQLNGAIRKREFCVEHGLSGEDGIAKLRHDARIAVALRQIDMAMRR